MTDGPTRIVLDCVALESPSSVTVTVPAGMENVSVTNRIMVTNVPKSFAPVSRSCVTVTEFALTELVNVITAGPELIVHTSVAPVLPNVLHTEPVLEDSVSANAISAAPIVLSLVVHPVRLLLWSAVTTESVAMGAACASRSGVARHVTNCGARTAP